MAKQSKMQMAPQMKAEVRYKQPFRKLCLIAQDRHAVSCISQLGPKTGK